MDDKVKDALERTLAKLTPLGETKPRHKTQPYQIRYKGQIVKTITGKSIWPSIGEAKNALNLDSYFIGLTDYRIRHSKEFKDALYASVEFVPVKG